MEVIDGILLVDKPKGWTSFDVVAKVRNILRSEYRKTDPSIKNVKVGHTGTLDPSATGLLVLCIGKATKLVPQLIKHDKTYEVEMTLGASSSTGDQEGEIKYESNPKIPSEEDLLGILNSFVGEQWQVPPAYSAIKIGGKRAYELARSGREIKLEPRKCVVYKIKLDSYSYPKAKFTCEVSSGTYIRSLVEDIGKKLGTPAYMSELRRTSIDNLQLSYASDLEDINYEKIKLSINQK